MRKIQGKINLTLYNSYSGWSVEDIEFIPIVVEIIKHVK